MYARNYGASSRNPKIVFEQTQESEQTNIKKPSAVSERSAESANDTEKDGPKTDTSPTKIEKSSNFETEKTDAECEEAAPFGEHGIPRQPLRRRKLPKRQIPNQQTDAETQCEPEQCEEHSSQPAPTSEPPSECERHAICPAKHESPARRRISTFSSEELLLAGLVLLLVNDRANDDVLLMLGFLLISGFSGD